MSLWDHRHATAAKGRTAVWVQCIKLGMPAKACWQLGLHMQAPDGRCVFGMKSLFLLPHAEFGKTPNVQLYSAELAIDVSKLSVLTPEQLMIQCCKGLHGTLE